jgi:hypothetical protein
LQGRPHGARRRAGQGKGMISLQKRTAGGLAGLPSVFRIPLAFALTISAPWIGYITAHLRPAGRQLV